MSISIYYTTLRKQPLSTRERDLIDAAVARFSVEKMIDNHSLNEAEFNGEEFCIYDPEDPTEPGDADWRVHMDDHEIRWDAKGMEYDPST